MPRRETIGMSPTEPMSMESAWSSGGKPVTHEYCPIGSDRRDTDRSLFVSTAASLGARVWPRDVWGVGA